MEDNYVIFKGTKSGLSIFLDKDLEFEELKVVLEKKLVENEDFFKGVSTGIILKGRELSELEEDELVSIIKNNVKFNIEYITTEDFINLRDIIKDEFDVKKDYSPTMFYHGNLRSGQTLSHDTSIVIFGDVNPGSKVIAGGNLIVMGSLRGSVEAGYKSNNSYIVAFDMNPKQLRIGDTIARAADDGEDTRIKKPHKAYLRDGQIFIDPIEGTFNV